MSCFLLSNTLTKRVNELLLAVKYTASPNCKVIVALGFLGAEVLEPRAAQRAHPRQGDHERVGGRMGESLHEGDVLQKEKRQGGFVTTQEKLHNTPSSSARVCNDLYLR